MTRYILAGGNDRADGRYGVRLATEIYSRHEGPLRILSCFFSSDPSTWDEKASDWSAWFMRYFGEDVIYSVASPDTFIDQIRASDVVYLHGGDNDRMIHSLRRYADFKQHIEGKFVIGSSAGANALSRYYWTRSKQQVGEGIGILEIAVMTHYGSRDGGFGDSVPSIDWQSAEAALVATAGSAELIRLHEGEFVVIET